MIEPSNLSDKIEQQLPPELADFVKEAGRLAASYGKNLYLVGGAVRDLLLGRANLDLDLVVEGDAIELAHRLMQAKQGKVTAHPHFKTAKLQWDKLSVDLTTARSETYARPGALPTVTTGTLKDDLFRRDFTINAMAAHLHPARFGEMVDLYGGRDDIERRLIRILHEKSFIDDATRIWRAIRYEQRLDFSIEVATLRLLRENVDMLDTISGDRIRYELECVLHEEYPEKTLHRADQLGVLQQLNSNLKGNGRLAKRFEQARGLNQATQTLIRLYLGLLCYPLDEKQSKGLIAHLRLPKSLAQVLRDITEIKEKLIAVSEPDLPSSLIYRYLQGYSQSAIHAVALASSSDVARRNIHLFLDSLRYIKPSLAGEDLKKLGVPDGPRMGELLQMLHEARLDKKAASKMEELALVKKWQEKENTNKTVDSIM